MHSLPSYPMSRPSRLLMADGRESQGGLVSREASLTLAIGPHTENLKLNVTKLGGYPIILGLPWLKRHDPYIHWSRHQITFCSDYCLSQCQVRTSCTLPAQPLASPHPEPRPSTRSQSSLQPSDSVPALRIPRSSSAAPAMSARLPNSEAYMQQASQYYEPCPRTRSKSSSPSSAPQSQPVATPGNRKTQNPILAPKVSLINSAAFNLCMRLPGSQMYKLYMSEITPADANANASPDPVSMIPAEY